MIDAGSSAALWAGVVVMGVYHGLNPAMGWPLAVANGMTDKQATAVFATLLPLGIGHLLAMVVVLLPFALLSSLLQSARELRIAAGMLVLSFGVFLWRRRRHPRWLARIGPSQLMLWSFLMATAHGAALMLLPIVIGLCAAPTAWLLGANGFDPVAVGSLMRSSIAIAITVSLVHTAAMVASGLGVAWLVYRYLGLRALRSAWFNLDRVWAISLIAGGAAAVLSAAA